MTAQVFVDESTSRGYLVAAAVVLPGDARHVRKTVGGFILRNQRRIHFKKESDARRKQIAAAIVGLGVEVIMYDAAGLPAREARRACFEQLVEDAAARSADLLVIERDDSVVEADRRVLFDKVRAIGYDKLRYHHQRAHEECLLSIPDAAAWCWAKGGSWRQLIQPAVKTVHRL